MHLTRDIARMGIRRWSSADIACWAICAAVAVLCAAGLAWAVADTLNVSAELPPMAPRSAWR